MDAVWQEDGTLDLGHGVLRLDAVPTLLTDGGAVAASADSGSGAGGVRVTRADGVTLTRRLAAADDGWLRLETRLDAARPLRVVRFSEGFHAAIANPDYVWSPALAPEPGDTQGDHAFRAPALILHRAPCAVALVPDLAVLGAIRHSDLPPPGSETPPAPQIKGFADLARCGADGYRLEHGLANYTIRAHVYYAFSGVPFDLPAGASLTTACYLRVSSAWRDPLDIGYVPRFLWRTFAGPGVASARPQMRPFDVYSAKSFAAVEAEGDLPAVTLPDGTRGVAYVNGYVRSLSVPRHTYFSIPAGCMWFSAWFNGLRVALGMRLHAERTGGDGAARLVETADGIRNVLQRAPDPSGCGWIPQLFHSHTRVWHNSVPRLTPAGDAGGFDVSASAHTGMLMLAWHRLVEPDAAFLDRCRRLGAALCAVQSAAGGFPAFVRADGSPAPELADSGHSGMAAWFLADLAEATGDPGARAAALRACRFFDEVAIPENRFQDFETYFSCSEKPLDFFDARTGQKPQNTLPIFWMAQTLLRVAEWGGDDARWMAAARRCLDRLALYQQVWSPPFLQGYVFGGFGVMNTDGEWNDMRQPKFAHAYLRAYEQSGLREDFERGVAALRAGYLLYCDPLHRAINPQRFMHFREGLMPENYAHCGPNERHAVMSGFDWGSGMQAAMCELALRRYGGLFVHAGHRHAFGLDGCLVRAAAFDDGGATLRVREATGVARAVGIVVRRGGAAARTTVRLEAGAEQEIRLRWSDLAFVGKGCRV